MNYDISDADFNTATKFDVNELHKDFISDKPKKSITNEIKRLKNHAVKCVFTNNKQGYFYAIKKLKSIHKTPYHKDDVLNMWNDQINKVKSRGKIK